MTVFLICAALLALVALAMLTRPLWHRPAASAAPGADAAAQARQQLQQLDALRTSGALDDAQHAEARAKVERQLGAALSAAPAATAQPGVPGVFIGGLAAFMCCVAAVGYVTLGTPVALDPAAIAAATAARGGGDGAGHSVTMEQIESMTEKLAARLKETPDDAEGWGMLGRSYAVLGKHDKAVPAFKQAMALQPNDAVLIADYADALAVVNGRSLEGEPSRLIDQALQADPNNLKALSLAGTAAFYRRDFADALRHWEKMKAVDPNSPFVQQIQGGIDEARQMMAGGTAGAAATPSPATPPAQAAAPATANRPVAGGGPSISGTVTLAKSIAGKASPEDTVFIFARPAEGPRMPLAILRKQVKDLPLTFMLDDSMAMSPAAKLSSAQRVIVGARISKRGDATAQPGDLQGLSTAVAPGARGLRIEIAEVVGP